MVMGAARPAGASQPFLPACFLIDTAAYISRARCCSSEEWLLAKPSQTDSWCCFLSQWALRVVLGRTIASGRRAVGVSAPGCQIQLADKPELPHTPRGTLVGEVRRFVASFRKTRTVSTHFGSSLSAAQCGTHCCHQHRVGAASGPQPSRCSDAPTFSQREEPSEGRGRRAALRCFFCA